MSSIYHDKLKLVCLHFHVHCSTVHDCWVTQSATVNGSDEKGKNMWYICKMDAVWIWKDRNAANGEIVDRSWEQCWVEATGHRTNTGCACLLTPVIPRLGRMRQGNWSKLKANPSYTESSRALWAAEEDLIVSKSKF